MTLLAPVTVSAAPVAPQENIITPFDPVATWVAFATRLVEPVPQFASRVGPLGCVDSEEGVVSRVVSDRSNRTIRPFSFSNEHTMS